jgi:hypothetical protein
VLGEDRRAVVVVARVGCLDVPVRLTRERANYVGERIVRQPTHAVVIGLAREHPVARNRRVALGAARALARVVPSGEEGTCVTDRNVRLPLRTGGSIGVQLERRAESHATVTGTNVIDVARVGAGAVLGID